MSDKDDALRDSVMQSPEPRADDPSLDLAEEMKLAILEKMGEQISDIYDTLIAVKPAGMSTQTYEKTLRDIRAQKQSLEWAHSCCVLQMGGGHA